MKDSRVILLTLLFQCRIYRSFRTHSLDRDGDPWRKLVVFVFGQESRAGLVEGGSCCRRVGDGDRGIDSLEEFLGLLTAPDRLWLRVGWRSKADLNVNFQNALEDQTSIHYKIGWWKWQQEDLRGLYSSKEEDEPLRTRRSSLGLPIRLTQHGQLKKAGLIQFARFRCQGSSKVTAGFSETILSAFSASFSDVAMALIERSLAYFALIPFSCGCVWMLMSLATLTAVSDILTKNKKKSWKVEKLKREDILVIWGIIGDFRISLRKKRFSQETRKR